MEDFDAFGETMAELFEHLPELLPYPLDAKEEVQLPYTYELCADYDYIKRTNPDIDVTRSLDLAREKAPQLLADLESTRVATLRCYESLERPYLFDFERWKGWRKNKRLEEVNGHRNHRRHLLQSLISRYPVSVGTPSPEGGAQPEEQTHDDGASTLDTTAATKAQVEPIELLSALASTVDARLQAEFKRLVAEEVIQLPARRAEKASNIDLVLDANPDMQRDFVEDIAEHLATVAGARLLTLDAKKSYAKAVSDLAKRCRLQLEFDGERIYLSATVATRQPAGNFALEFPDSKRSKTTRVEIPPMTVSISECG